MPLANRATPDSSETFGKTAVGYRRGVISALPQQWAHQALRELQELHRQIEGVTVQMHHCISPEYER